MAGSKAGARMKLLDAAVSDIRAKGYSATTVDDICKMAGVSKGAFFHHFQNKDELAVAAAAHFAAVADSVFATAAYRALPDPVDRLLGYVDFRKAILVGGLPEFTCLLGTMVQETYDRHPAIRQACDRYISEHTAMVEADIAEAMGVHVIGATWSAASLADYTHAVVQGAFVMAKARHNAAVAADCLDHLKRYLEAIFMRPKVLQEC